jgi:predicted PurR-regulated permease PerM
VPSDPALATTDPLADAGPADATLSSTAPLEETPRSSTATTVLAAIAVVAVLWWGQRFLVPVAAGLMLTLLLAPAVTLLERLFRVRVISVLIALGLFLGGVTGATWAFGGQVLRMIDRSPAMISLMADQIAHTEPDADSVLKRSRDALQQLDRAAQSVANGTAMRQRPRATPTPAAGTTPITEGATVVLRETAKSGSTVLFKFAADLTVILFVAFFVLSGGARLADRFVNLWGHSAHGRMRAERGLEECGRQIRLYAGVLLVTNTVIGVTVWIVFAMSGLPDAAMWGVTAAVLHVIPYLGMALLTAMGAAETFLVHGTFGSAIGMAAFVVVLSTLVGTAMTAWLQSRAAKMNPAAVFIGLCFWGALWGVWGLFLGPALVVVLKVIAQNSRSAHRMAKLMAG